MADRLSTPGAVLPIVARNSPITGFTRIPAAFQLPDSSDFFSTPWAVAHESHQRTTTSFTFATRRVTFIGIRATAFFNEAGPITPGAIVPVVLDATLAARAARRHSRLGSSSWFIKTTPRATLHTLGDRTLATPARMARFERLFEMPLKLTPLHLPP